MEIRRLGSGDDESVMAASHLFDGPADHQATRRFLEEEGHHLLVAYVGDHPAGFVTGVETTHPDKGTEMFLYELAVDAEHRHAGIGRALVEALRDLGLERGCYGMRVLTDDDNAAALATYERAGATRHNAQVMLDWTF